MDHVPHIYARIIELQDGPAIGRHPGQCVKLNDGTLFHLPLSAETDFKKLQEGDIVLIDLQDWHGGIKFGDVYVYRRRHDDLPGMNVVTRFLIGEHCVILLAGK
jgi:hypothetical protein